MLVLPRCGELRPGAAVASQFRPVERLRGGSAVRPAQPAAPSSDGLERARLPARDRFLVEASDRVLVHAMKVEPRAKAQESAAEADRRRLRTRIRAAPAGLRPRPSRRASPGRFRVAHIPTA